MSSVERHISDLILHRLSRKHAFMQTMLQAVDFQHALLGAQRLCGIAMMSDGSLRARILVTTNWMNAPAR